MKMSKMLKKVLADVELEVVLNPDYSVSQVCSTTLIGVCLIAS